MACVRCVRNLESFSRLAVKRLVVLSQGRFCHTGSDGGKGDKFSEDSSSEKHEEEDHELRERVLEAALPFVKQHGWTKKSLTAGAEMEGLPQIAHGMFPRGGVELVHFFYARCNQELARSMEEQLKQLGEEKPKTRPFIEKAVRKRLEMITPYIEQWPQAMAIQTLPQNAVESWKNLANLTDDIWFYAGDRSTDFNWYTKRASLAAVYKSTEIYMVQDRSDEYTDTWKFLDRRLDNLASFGKSVRSMEQTSSVFGESLMGMCIVGRNMLGMNARRR